MRLDTLTFDASFAIVTFTHPGLVVSGDRRRGSGVPTRTPARPWSQDPWPILGIDTSVGPCPSCPSMKRPTRVEVYEGLYRSQADERFQADATEAARHGWRPVEGFWNGEELAVTYVHEGPDWRASKDPGPLEPGPRARSSRRRAVIRTSVLLLVALASVLLLALVAGTGDVRRIIPV